MVHVMPMTMFTAEPAKMNSMTLLNQIHRRWHRGYRNWGPRVMVQIYTSHVIPQAQAAPKWAVAAWTFPSMQPLKQMDPSY
jgi:hypothetical protein